MNVCDGGNHRNHHMIHRLEGKCEPPSGGSYSSQSAGTIQQTLCLGFLQHWQGTGASIGSGDFSEGVNRDLQFTRSRAQLQRFTSFTTTLTWYASLPGYARHDDSC